MERYNDVPQHEREDFEYRQISDPRFARRFLIELGDLSKPYTGMILACHPDLRQEFWDQVSDESRFWAVIFDEKGGVDHASIKAVVHEECERVYALELEMEAKGEWL